MIKGQSVMCLDGNFKKDYPTPEAFSYRDGDKWLVTKRGPRYVNTYEVTEYDEAGARWLAENEVGAPRADAAPAAT